MSIENILERIAVALEKLAGSDQFGALPPPVVEAPKKTRAKKAEPTPTDDTIPGMDDVTTTTAPDVLVAEDPAIKTGAELRNLAQSLIQAAEQSDPGGKSGAVNKLVTFIQSVAKIFHPAEPKLIKIPDAKVAEAAAMITNWCEKNGIRG